MTEETTKTTMRELLQRWAELEPKRCRLHEEVKGVTVSTGKWWHLILDCKLSTEESLMLIQWSAQEAITARGWSFSVGHDSHYGFGYEAEINASLSQEINTQGHTSAAEVLLTAYLQALGKASQ